jgi:topoisomerase-4 subunit A
LYFTANPNGEAEVITVQLKPHTKLKKLQFDLDYAEIAIKGRASQGNIVSKYPIKKILLKTKGVSTLSGLKIWYDDLLRRLNVDGRGKYLGEFDGDDKILQVHKEGWYELSTFELSNHFDADLILIQKFDPEKPFTVVQYEGKAKNYFIKRFVFESIAVGKKGTLISEENGSRFLYLTSNPEAVLTVDVLKGKTQIPETLEIVLAEFIDVKGIKANGNRITQHDVKNVSISNHEELELVLESKVSIPDASSNEEQAEGETTETTADVTTSEEEENIQEVEESNVEPEAVSEEPEVEQEEASPVVKKPFVVAKEPKPVSKEEPVEKVEEKPSEEAAERKPKKAWGTPKTSEKESKAKPEGKEEPKAKLKPVAKETPETKKDEKDIPAKEIKFEITNPDDIEIDDKGQLGLF